jgi:hypothetical protein
MTQSFRNSGMSFGLIAALLATAAMKSTRPIRTRETTNGAPKATPENESRQVRRARERREGKKGKNRQ